MGENLMAAQTTATSPTNQSHITRGLLLASLVIPVGIALWVILWQYGFIASIVAFGIAYAAVWLYKKGAGDTTRTAAPYLIALIVLAVVLAFLGGMVSDAWYVYSQDLEGAQGFFSAEFIDFFMANITTAELWQGYAFDLLVSVVFAALGASGVIRDLYKQDQPTKPQPKNV